MIFFLLVMQVLCLTVPQENQSHRILYVFGSLQNQSLVEEQIARFEAMEVECKDRDLKILPVDKLPEKQKLLKRYQIQEHEFVVLLIGKDRGVKLSSKELVSTQQIFSLIDAMPMRQWEMKHKKTGS